MQRSRWLLSFMLAILLSPVAIGAQPQYTMTDLGALQPVAVIDGPIVFGNFAGEPVVWQAGQVRTLQHYGHGGQVSGANARGDSVGWVWLPVQGSLRKVASFWYPDGAVTLLPGSGETEARGLNMDRIIAGVHLTEERALRWVPGALEEYLDTPRSYGRAVDASGRVWGYQANEPVAWDLDGSRHGFANIGVIQASPSAANNTIAAGWAGRGATVSDAAYFSIPLTVTRLRAPDASLDRPFCGASAINNRQVAVGVCSHSGANPLAMMWPDANTIINLNAVSNVPFLLEYAVGISEDGHIVGITGTQGWLLTPATQPPAMALRVNQASFQPGQVLDTALELRNPGPQRTVDMYVGIIFPDGWVWWFTDVNTLDGAASDSLDADPRTFTPLWAGMTLMAGVQAIWTDFIEHTWIGIEPQGTYHLVVGWTMPSSLADGVIHEGDLVALDWKAFSVARGGQALVMNR